MIRRSALGHRTRGVTAPLAPRAGIQGRTAQARQLHGENVMARGNSRAAIMNHLVARHLAQQACELVAQQLWRFKATVVAHVLRNGTVQRTVNPTGDRVDGFVFTTDRKSTRLNSSHVRISYAVFCLKKKKKKRDNRRK